MDTTACYLNLDDEWIALLQYLFLFCKRSITKFRRAILEFGYIYISSASCLLRGATGYTRKAADDAQEKCQWSYRNEGITSSHHLAQDDGDHHAGGGAFSCKPDGRPKQKDPARHRPELQLRPWAKSSAPGTVP
jgi:hypothetical protein